jgi:nitroreductase
MEGSLMRTRNRTATVVLAEAAAAAGFAPSVHNTQPWRWRVRDEALDLYADRSRQLLVADPDGRLLTISCGTALHHCRVALAAEGWTASVDRLPDPADPDHLARITLAERVPVSPESMSLFQAVRLRHTDRRAVSDAPPAPEAISAVRQASTAEGVDVHLLTAEQISDLGSAAARADQIETVDSEQRAELAYWIGGDRARGTGVPDAVIPERAPQTVVPGRDFVHEGTLPIGEGHDRAAEYLMLFGSGDGPVDWLRAGEALSAGWLTATQQGLCVLPFSSVIEVIATRETLRRMLAGLGYPYLVLRLGNADQDEAFPPHTPRLAAEQLIEVSPQS